MKKAFLVFLALLLCLGICGCEEDNHNSSDNTPQSSNNYETVSQKEPKKIYGVITGKESPDILVLKLYNSDMEKEFGETVHIVTDQADKWCIDDYIDIHYRVMERPKESTKNIRIIAESINESFASVGGKPIIYLYPETPTVCSAKVSLNVGFTCTYPSYGENGWQDFTAHPDGTLIFPDGKEYYALYWEGLLKADWDFSKGWCVRGEDTAEFLEWALAKQGLTPREANEFIIYWLPFMQENPYNIISFQTTAYTDAATLEITPKPDSILRIFMTYYPSDTEVRLEPQTFNDFERKGFTVVEWGASQTKKP